MNDESRPESHSTRTAPRSPNEAIQPEPAPAPPASRRARSSLVVALSGIFTFLLLIVLGIGAVLYIGLLQFEGDGPLDAPRTVNIPQGQGAMEISKLLEREGVVDNWWVLFGGIVLHKAQADLKAGEYLFPEQASMRQAMNLIVEGKAILHRVTIPEGYTSEQVVARLNEHPVLVGDIEEIPAEGTLLPETYTFDRGTSRQQIIDRMRHAHDEAVAGIWERRSPDLPIETPEQMVNLASIVEKETGRADERPRVAAVFINRLRQGMRLQSDPTILYGLFGGKAFMEYRTITRSQLDAENPYSTYQISGLPPTPIANPGRESMEAVANPSRTSELYFVADGTGGHIFGETLEEHNRNVARWRELQRERAAQAEAEAESAEEDAGAAEGDEGGAGLRGLNLNTQ